jgi:hypothetical protein
MYSVDGDSPAETVGVNGRAVQADVGTDLLAEGGSVNVAWWKGCRLDTGP